MTIVSKLMMNKEIYIYVITKTFELSNSKIEIYMLLTYL